MTYQLAPKLAEGEHHERALDSYLNRWYRIRDVARVWQRLGIDRILTCRRTGRVISVQYKADTTAARTGNAFIETTSVDTAGVPGWALTCAAQYVVYYIPPRHVAYVVPGLLIKTLAARWQAEGRPTRRIPNDGYCAEGMLIPLSEFATHAERTLTIPAPQEPPAHASLRRAG